MSDSGPTTAGAIVGKLSLDKAQWDRDVAEAKAQAAELGALHPKVTVDADTAAALAKLQEVHAAAGDSTSHVVTTTTTVGDNGNDAAADGAKRLAEAEKLAAAATDDQGRAANNAANGNRLNLSYMGLIVGAIAAILPMATQLTGAAVGLAGGFAGMGAAGVLAVLGVRNAMADGTAMGDQFDAGLQILLGDLHQLEQTAAGGVLTGFISAVDTIDQNMPQLNGEIGVFAQQLGTTVSVIMNGVVTALEVMNPLFVQGAFFVEQLAAGFTRWTQDGGLAQFTQMAIASLPQVTTALGSLLNGVVNLIGAFSGAGPFLLEIITGLGQLLSVVSLLGPALPVLAFGALAAFGAFKGWQALVPIILSVQSGVAGFMGSMSALIPLTEAEAAASGTYTDLLVTQAGVLDAVAIGEDEVAAATDVAATAFKAAAGPIGIVLAIVGGLAVAFMAATSATSQGTTAMSNYTTAVQQDNGVIGAHVKAQAADSLQKTGALALAKQLGVATTTLTGAVTNDDTARKKLVKTLEDQVAAGTKAEYAGRTWITVQDATAKSAQKLLDIVNSQHGAIIRTVGDYNDVANAMGVTTISSKQQLQAQTDLAARYGMSLPALLTAQGTQSTLAAQTQATTQALQLENDAAGLLTNAFNLLNGTNLSVAQAQTNAAAATNTFTDSLSTNGTEIDGNSKGAIANQQALEGKAAADQAAAEAIAKQTGSTQAGTAAFAASKQALIDQLTASGNLTPAIQALIDKYYAVPPVVKTKAELDADAAMAALDAYKAKLASIHDQTVTLTVVTNKVTGAPAAMPANVTGGLYKQADGGTVHAATGLTVPGSAGPYGDSVHMLLAPSEEVISNRNGQADRNRGLLKLVSSGADSRTIANYANGAGGGGQSGPVMLSLAGATIQMSVDGHQMTAIIQDQIIRADRVGGMVLRARKQRGQ